VDIDRKRWEEDERSSIAESRGTPSSVRARHAASVGEIITDEEEEAKRRGERLVLIEELAQDTLKGRGEAQDLQAKRSREKMARLELIRKKAQIQLASSGKSAKLESKVSVNDGEKDGDDSWIFGDDEDVNDDDGSRAKSTSTSHHEGSPEPKRRKLIDS